MAANYTRATQDEVFYWLQQRIFTVKDQEVYSRNGRKLAQRKNTRQRSDRGDLRVDLKYNGRRRSCHVSQLVWMATAGEMIPPGYEIHHRNGDPEDNSWENLIALHAKDHAKLHSNGNGHLSPEDETPF